MTLISVMLLGVGVILIASSLDNTPIVDTFQKILKGQSIDWSGTNDPNIGGTIASERGGSGEQGPVVVGGVPSTVK